MQVREHTTFIVNQRVVLWRSVDSHAPMNSYDAL